MSLRIIIENQYINSIKSKKPNETNILRLIKSAIKDKDIENRTTSSNNEINDQQILVLLQSLIKQRRDSIDSFKDGAREDLIADEKFEINFINQFLPKQFDEEETSKIVKKIIQEKKLSSFKDMGILMSNLKANYSGNINMSIAGKIAKSILNN